MNVVDSLAIATKKKFQQDVEITREQIRRQNWGIINPRRSRWVHYWDAATFACLFFTALVTPFEVGLMDMELLDFTDGPGVALFTINQLINAFFFCDILLNFCLAYQEPIYKGGRWVTSRKKIAAHYLQSWFVIDLISTMPFDLTISLGLLRGSDIEVLRMARIIRLIRLVKLLRILRASRILARWQSYIGLSYAMTTMIKFMVVTVFLIHMMACSWAYAGASNPLEDTVFPTIKDDDDDRGGEHILQDVSWPVYYHLTPDDIPDATERISKIYVVALNQAVCAMFGSTGLVRPHTPLEYLATTTMMVLGTMVWAWVIASLCGILATLDPHATAYRNLMDELNFFMKERNFPQDHRVRLRDFFRHTQDFSRQHSYDKLMLKMSAQLRGDTALRIGTDTLKAVWYFNGTSEPMEQQFLAVVALNLTPAVFEAREIIPTGDLTIIDRGVASLRLVMLGKGMALGKDCVIPDRHAALRSQEAAYTLTFVQTAFISRQLLFAAVEHFPVAKQVLKRAAAVYTIRAAFRLAFTDWRKKTATGLRYTQGHAALAAFSGGGSSLMHLGPAGCNYSAAQTPSAPRPPSPVAGDYWQLSEEDLSEARKEREKVDDVARDKVRTRGLLRRQQSSLTADDNERAMVGDAAGIVNEASSSFKMRAVNMPSQEVTEKVFRSIIRESEKRTEDQVRELRVDVKAQIGILDAKLTALLSALQQTSSAGNGLSSKSAALHTKGSPYGRESANAQPFASRRRKNTPSTRRLGANPHLRAVPNSSDVEASSSVSAAIDEATALCTTPMSQCSGASVMVRISKQQEDAVAQTAVPMKLHEDAGGLREDLEA